VAWELVKHSANLGAGIAQWYSAGLRAGWLGVWDQAGAGNFTLHHRVQTGSGAYPASNQWVPGPLSLAVKRPRREADHSPPSSAKVKNAWSYNSTPQYAFMGWFSIKAQGQLYLLPFFYFSAYHLWRVEVSIGCRLGDESKFYVFLFCCQHSRNCREETQFQYPGFRFCRCFSGHEVSRLPQTSSNFLNVFCRQLYTTVIRGERDNSAHLFFNRYAQLLIEFQQFHNIGSLRKFTQNKQKINLL
jgi:hypothetical protein